LQGLDKLKYNIDGRHSTIFPIQLPPLLSPKVVEEMVKKFENYLLIELQTLEENRKKAKFGDSPRPPSRQSVGSQVSSQTVHSEFGGGILKIFRINLRRSAG
jgi:hypothetical protein